MELNIVGDLHGNFKTLIALLKKMPKTAKPFSTGDMIDRGPRSKECLDFFMSEGDAVLGNHEDMLIDAYENYKRYDRGLPFYNGAHETMYSFGDDGRLGEYLDLDDGGVQAIRENIDPKYIEWMKARPIKFSPEGEGLIITHAPINSFHPIEISCDINHAKHFSSSVIWNVGHPKRRDKFQIYGHICRKEIMRHTDKEGEFAIGLDTLRGGMLTGLHWPSMRVYNQEVID